jgi:hypothetical protein
MDYRFDRHFAISQAIGARFETFVMFPFAHGAAEYCGDVQQMVQLFEKQLGVMRECYKRGITGEEIACYLLWAAPSVTGLELNALHPFGKEQAGLLGSCEGRCTDPSDCEDWFESSHQWSAQRARFGEGISSKDGWAPSHETEAHHNRNRASGTVVVVGINGQLQLRCELARRSARR